MPDVKNEYEGSVFLGSHEDVEAVVSRNNSIHRSNVFRRPRDFGEGTERSSNEMGERINNLTH